MASADTDETLESYDDGSWYQGSRDSLREWFLVDGNRPVIALGSSVAVFLLLLALYEVGVVGFENDDSITRMSGGMIAGTFSLVTIVISINQLILSQELGQAGELREKLGGLMEFRRDIEEMANIPASPTEPTELLSLITARIRDRAERLRDADADGEASPTVAKYANTVVERTEEVEDQLEAADFGTFNAVSTMLRYDDAWLFYAARHVRNEHESTLPSETIETFDELIDALQTFNVARSHFKSTYLQRELAQLSRLTLLFGLPAVVAAMLVGLVYADPTGPAIADVYLPYVTSALITVVLSPLVLVASYILRTATIARRTASIGPLLSDKDPDSGPFDVSYQSDSASDG